MDLKVLEQQPGESAAKYKTRMQKIEKELIRLSDKTRFNKIAEFVGMPKQKEFWRQGSRFRERMFSAGNQLGKTEGAAAEIVYHVTGDYPDDWDGKRFDGPVKVWVCGVTAILLRDGPQKKLFGNPAMKSDLGSGLIPKAAIVGQPTASRSATDAYDTAIVKHKAGGHSVLIFKSYEQGREKFQSDSVDIIWCDEEPDEDIYSECLTRTNATQGITMVTFTPLKGRTALYMRFTDENKGDRGFVNMTIEDAAALPAYDTAEKRRAIIDAYPAHERDARARGVPMMGEGRIFIYDETALAEPQIQYVPPHFYKWWAIDFGIAINHKFAAALLMWDKDYDIIHLHHAFKIADKLPLHHAVQMKQIAANLPVVWPHDGGNREKGSGEELQALYKKQGLLMMPEHATFETGGYSTEAGILDMDDRMKTGRFKVANHLTEFFEEYRMYHRKDGLIVRTNDDILSAVRIGIMMKRAGKAVMMGNKKPNRNNGEVRVADGAELSGRDLF